MISNVLYSSKSDEWETPHHIFDELNDEFDFDLDPCASAENHKTGLYYDIDANGLEQDWGGHKVFCNPPYSEIKAWVKKAYEESQKDNTLVVMLIPARTDTKYFHEYIYHKAEIRFIKGRLKFGNAKNNAPFPSMIVVFRSSHVLNENKE